MPPQSPSTSWTLPIAIILGCSIIAGVIFFANLDTQTPQQAITRNTEPSTELTTPVRMVTSYDYVRGNPDASIMIVTYTDYECVDCKQFHSAMNRIIGEYGMTGQVAWTMRHMPLENNSTSPNAVDVTIAAECVGSLGGNSSFWKFADLVFSERPFEGSTDIAQLPDYAYEAGVDRSDFVNCLQNEEYKEYITATTEEALAAGATHQPYTVFMVGNQQGSLNGAQPHIAIKEVVEKILAQIEDQLLDEEYLENL